MEATYNQENKTQLQIGQECYGLINMFEFLVSPLLQARTLLNLRFCMRSEPPEIVSLCQSLPWLSSHRPRDQLHLCGNKQAAEAFQICFPILLLNCFSSTWINPGKKPVIPICAKQKKNNKQIISCSKLINSVYLQSWLFSQINHGDAG